MKLSLHVVFSETKTYYDDYFCLLRFLVSLIEYLYRLYLTLHKNELSPRGEIMIMSYEKIF